MVILEAFEVMNSTNKVLLRDSKGIVYNLHFESIEDSFHVHHQFVKGLGGGGEIVRVQRTTLNMVFSVTMVTFRMTLLMNK